MPLPQGARTILTEYVKAERPLAGPDDPLFRHSCGVELLRRTHGNLRAVQEHLRHTDIQTTTLYTRLTQGDLEKVVSVFDVKGEQKRDSSPYPTALKLGEPKG